MPLPALANARRSLSTARPTPLLAGLATAALLLAGLLATWAVQAADDKTKPVGGNARSAPKPALTVTAAT